MLGEIPLGGDSTAVAEPTSVSRALGSTSGGPSHVDEAVVVAARRRFPDGPGTDSALAKSSLGGVAASAGSTSCVLDALRLALKRRDIVVPARLRWGSNWRGR